MELRKSPRHNLNLTAQLYLDHQPHVVTVLDISAGGAQVTTDELCLTAEMVVDLNLPILEKLKASVVWTKGKRCGLRFHENQDRINEFLYNLATYGTPTNV